MKLRGWLVLSGMAIAIALAGCSRADPSIIVFAAQPSGGAEGGPPPLQASTDAGGALKYQQETLNAPADQALTLDFQNPSALQHNWVLVKPGQEQAVVDAAAAKNGDATGLEGTIAVGALLNGGGNEQIQILATPAGSYTYLCTVPGHYAAGMKGTLTLGAPAAGGEAGGTSGGATPGGGGGPITVGTDAGNALKYQQAALQTKAGQPFTVDFQNPAALQHNWVLVKPGQEQAVVDAAAAKQGDATGLDGTLAAGALLNGGGNEPIQVPALDAGTYTYLCTVPGHYVAGMKGTLTVAP